MADGMGDMFKQVVSIFLLLGSGVCFSADEPIRPLQKISGLDPDVVSLGDSLFHDVRLSADNSISCASCHDLSTNGADSRALSVGIKQRTGLVKSPTVYNSALNFVQFWDGRSRTLEQQASGPVHNPLEMGSHWGEVVTKLSKDPALVERFEQSYPEGLTASNIIDAIAVFERTLITTGSRFDQWLEGDKGVLDGIELEGYELFKSYGCISCHQGQNVGGNMYAPMGAMKDYFRDRGNEIQKPDLGRFNVTGDPRDKHLFKVPSLRLAAIQNYFFHDASVDNLESAVQVMARYQLGRDISGNDVQKIAAFIRSLAGKHPKMVEE